MFRVPARSKVKTAVKLQCTKWGPPVEVFYNCTAIK